MATKCMFVLLAFIVPADTLEPTEGSTRKSASYLWLSCKECSESFMNSSFDLRCRHGCDRYFTLNPPISITKPTTLTKFSNGSYLDCKECFGHGLNPSADPRCKYGCGRFMTYPAKYYFNSIPTESPIYLNTDSTEMLFLTTDSFAEGEEFGNQMAFAFPVKKSVKDERKKDRDFYLLLGITVAAVFICTGYFSYKKKVWRKVLKKSRYSNSVATVTTKV